MPLQKEVYNSSTQLCYHLCARLVSPHASTDVILVPKIKTFADRGVIHN